VGAIEIAEPDYVGSISDTIPNDTNFNLLWGMHNTGQTIGGQAGVVDADIDAPAAWNISTGSSNIVVAVIDTGVDYNHPDLTANMWRNPGEIPGNDLDDDGNGLVDDVYGWDFANDDNDPFDDHNHGTHCAGTIGGFGNNGAGVAGVCWNVRIMAVKWILGSGGGATSDAIDAVHYTTMMRVRLTSNSWHIGGYSAGLESAIAEADTSNILFVCAAANSGVDLELNPDYPPNFTNANMIVVAATDNRDQLASFSNYGLLSVDLGAPGVSIWSCKPGNQYQYLNGTSMACPDVAGACALSLALAPDATAMQIKQAILDGTELIAALSNKCVTRGRLNIYNTLQKLERNVTLIPATGAGFSGYSGGPFTPPSSTYTLSNIGTNFFSWTATKTATWLDLSLTTGSLFPGQSNAVVVSINTTANTQAVGTYTDTLTFSNTASTGVQTRTVVLTVQGDMSFDSASYTVSEAGGTALITVRRDGNTNRAVTVNYAASNGTAMAGSDYAATTGTLEFAVGDTLRSFTVPILEDALGEGNETVNLGLSNPTGGGTLGDPRVAILTIVDDDIPDYFTELFDTLTNDLDNQMFTFTPDGSASSYRANRDPTNAFPSSASGTVLSLSDDSYVQVNLVAGAQVSLYGTNYTSLFIGSNGYITFGSGDSTWSESFANHFNKPRISALFDDLNPGSGGTVTWIQLVDRVVVTFQNVPEYDASNQNSFQYELFFNGVIRLTYLVIAAQDGLAGLSRGQGVPADFTESDFTSYGPSVPPDALVVQPTGGLTAQGYQGGPFTPSNTVYALSNTGASNLSWTAGCAANWVTVAPGNGTIAVGQTNLVTVSFNANANSLGAGTNTSTIVFSNITSGISQSRSVQLVVRPRELDHFAWSTIAATQYVGQSFPVTITAQDVANNTANNFNGSVALNGLIETSTNRIMLTDLGYSMYGYGVPGTRGVQFQPTKTITVTHFRHFWGTQVSIWTDSGVLVATKDVVSVNGTWLETPLDSPVVLTSGTVYCVVGYTAGGLDCCYWRSGGTPTNFADGVILSGAESSGNTFPGDRTSDRYLVDMRYTVGSGGPVNIAPTNSGNFVSGVWNGVVMVLEPATNIMHLRADDGIGHSGTSGVFTVLSGSPDDLDNDGLPNWWEQLYFGDPVSANPAGICSNGINTVREAYIAGLNPNDRQSAFMASFTDPLSSANVLQWQDISGRVYTIYWTSNLLSGFTPMQSNYTGGVFTDTIHSANDDGFYRIEVRLAP
jgi:hypothetical protein